MGYSAILKNIAKHITLDEKETNCFTSLLSYRELKKKENILQKGQLCRNISYVQNGVVLRLKGASKGADEDVRIARERGLPVYYSLEEVPKKKD